MPRRLTARALFSAALLAGMASAAGAQQTGSQRDPPAGPPAAAPSGGRIDALVPAWARQGGDAAFRKRVGDPVLEDSILRGIVDNILAVPGVSDLSRVQFSRVSWDTNTQSKTLKELAECRNLEPTPENGARVLLEALLGGGDSATYHVLGEPRARAKRD